ncbi:MAG: hypothetical protein H0T42_11080 [Deltaproteobacteria bacterium]|nr:hypothetical protein [Deltaproteobacteria bacterium]
MRRALLLLVCLAGAADARPPVQLAEDPESAHRPALEWSTWFRLGFGMRPADPDAAARTTTPPPPAGQVTTWEAALGIDLTGALSGSGNIRIGPWLEVRGLSVVGGGELVIQRVPKTIDMFLYEGQGVLVMRAGGNHERATGQLAYGYLAPWNLFRPDRGAARYMIGVRFVATYTRAIEDPRDWSATIGLETEPVGALRFLLGIRSWY